MKLEFVPNPAEEGEGLSASAIETVRDDPSASSARETGQNSRDAATSLPVTVTFDLLDVSTSQLPDVSRLKQVLALCLKQVIAAKKTKEMDFFQQALGVVDEERLKIRRIADYNTTGVRGPSKEGTPFHSLLRSTGISDKPDETALGSFGIGKAAAFTISNLQTVFYSTVYTDGDKQYFLAQGKSLLISHRDEKGEPQRRAGYWGFDKVQPATDAKDVPEWLRRKENGTSVFAVGFRKTSNWQRRIACSLLQNFFSAIHHGEMEFVIDAGKISIGKLDLESLFSDPGMMAVAVETDRQQQFELSHDLYRCLISSEAKEKEVFIEGLGRVWIRVLVADDLPKKVCILRHGMVITDSLEAFGEKFSQFRMCRDFVALVIPDEQAGAFIRKLENPEHNRLSAERLSDASQREPAKRIMKKLGKIVREAIKSYTQAEVADEVTIDELRRYFSTEPQTAPKDGASAAENPETLTYTVEPRRPKVRPRAIGAKKGNVGSGGGPTPPGPGPGPGAGPGPSPAPGLRHGPRPAPKGEGRKRTR